MQVPTRLRAGGEGGSRRWDGWMASLTQRTWVWADSGRWWRTGKPGMLQSTGSQRVRHDWAPEQQQLKGTKEPEKNGWFQFWDRKCTKWVDLPCIRKQRSYQRPLVSCRRALGTKLKGFQVPKYGIIWALKRVTIVDSHILNMFQCVKCVS